MFVVLLAFSAWPKQDQIHAIGLGSTGNKGWRCHQNSRRLFQGIGSRAVIRNGCSVRSRGGDQGRNGQISICQSVYCVKLGLVDSLARCKLASPPLVSLNF